MKRKLFPTPARVGLLLLLGLGSFVGQRGLGAQAVAPTPRYAPDTVLVAFHGSLPLTARLNTVNRFGLVPAPGVQSPYFATLKITKAARVAGATVPTLVAALRRDPTVRLASPNFIRTLSGQPNDPQFGQQWGLHNVGQTHGTEDNSTSAGVNDADIDALEAWDKTTGSDTIIVAVIDSGVDYNHPDLKDNIYRKNGVLVGYDFGQNDADPMDRNGHGTHCAGIIGARGNNLVGVSGVCQRVKIIPLKATTSLADKDFGDDAVIKSYDYARTNGARVINASYGGEGSDPLELEAIQRLRDAGILFCAASGNETVNNDTKPSYPCNYNGQSNNVLSVGSTDDKNGLSDFSNYGVKTVDMAGPGTDILSTTPNNTYSVYSGTSMATPMVAGAAALILAQNPGLTMLQLKDRILTSLDILPSLNGKIRTSGRLNVNRALATAGDAFEPDDASTTAKAIAPGETQNRSIHAVGNADWAKFTLTATSTVTIETGPATADTGLFLYGPNASTTLIASNADRSTTDRSAIITRSLAAGTYYVRVQEGGNNAVLAAYTLKLSVAGAGDAFEPDDLATQAKVIAAGATQNRSIHAAGNVDWASFTLTAPGNVTIDTGPTTADTQLFLYGPNAATTQIATNDDRSAADVSSQIQKSGLAAGTYYIKVQTSTKAAAPTVAAYTLRLTVTGGDAFEPDDTALQAKAIAAGETQNHSIHVAGNVDWAKFTLTATSTVTVETGPSTADTELFLYGPNTSTTQIATNDDRSATDGSSLVTKSGLVAGTYYVKVQAPANAASPTIAAYTLKLTVSTAADAFEVDDTAATAKAITAGQTQNRSIHVAGNVDWAKFTLTTPGTATIETGPATADTELFLYGPNSSTTQIATNNDRSATDRSSLITKSGLAAGTYYVKAQEAGNNAPLAAYTLKLTVTSGTDAFESDDTAATAKAIAAGQTQNHTIHSATDVDWVTFSVATTSNIIVETGPDTADTEIFLYGPNSATTQLATNDDRSDNVRSSLIQRRVTPGTYYVKVQGYQGTVIPAYTLRLTATAATAHAQPRSRPVLASEGVVNSGVVDNAWMWKTPAMSPRQKTRALLRKQRLSV